MLKTFGPSVLCRPARASDTEAVLALTRNIWDGRDYVPQVWAQWLADPEGQLSVAEFAGRVVGLGKLTRLGPREWWLEGLRVDPSLQGRGIASRLHHYHLHLWKARFGDGRLRLATASHNQAVQHLSERTGFVRVGEVTEYAAPAAAGPHAFVPFSPEDTPRALAVSLLSNALVDLGWRWGDLDETKLRHAAVEGRAFRWNDWAGVLMAYDETGDDGRPLLSISRAAAAPGCLPDLLHDFRALAAERGAETARWLVPIPSPETDALTAAGFMRAWDDSLVIFERKD